MNTVDAIVLAGRGKPHGFTRKLVYRAFFQEEFIPGYKHTRPFTLNGKTAPLIDYAMTALADAQTIGRIALVGELDELEPLTFKKEPLRVQSEEFILRNAVKGREALGADVCLCLAGDLPYMIGDDIDHFTQKAQALKADLVIGLAAVQDPPVVWWPLKRWYFPVIDDIGFYEGGEPGAIIGARYAQIYYGRPTAKGLAPLEDIYVHGRRAWAPDDRAFFQEHYPEFTSKALKGFGQYVAMKDPGRMSDFICEVLHSRPGDEILRLSYVEEQLSTALGGVVKLCRTRDSVEKDIDTIADCR